MAPPTTVPYCPIGRPNYGTRPNCPRAGDNPTSIMGGLRNIGSAIAKGAKATGRAIEATDRFLNDLDDDLGSVDEIVEGAACLTMSPVPPAATASGAAVLLEQTVEEIEDRIG